MSQDTDGEIQEQKEIIQLHGGKRGTEEKESQGEVLSEDE